LEEWVQRALAKWPKVPALFGWLSLDRRGRWLIRGEGITRPQIIDTINLNYAADDQGRWYFQNGPQRGYMQLAYAPFILRRSAHPMQLETHTGQAVSQVLAAYLDEQGSLLLLTEHGPGLVADNELDWVMERLRSANVPVDEQALEEALALASGNRSALILEVAGVSLPVDRLDEADIPGKLGFVRDPQPAEGERFSRGEAAVD
jgi:hypothetical protein